MRGRIRRMRGRSRIVLMCCRVRGRPWLMGKVDGWKLYYSCGHGWGCERGFACV